MTMPYYHVTACFKDIQKTWGEDVGLTVERRLTDYFTSVQGGNMAKICAHVLDTPGWEKIQTALCDDIYAEEDEADRLTDVQAWGNLMLVDPTGRLTTLALKRGAKDGDCFENPDHAYRLILLYAMEDLLSAFKDGVERWYSQKGQNK